MNYQEEFIRNCMDAFRPFTISNEVALFIACQFSLESNYGKSSLAIVHNLCGMKKPCCRLSIVSYTKKGDFMSYPSDMLCCVDYLLWLSYNHFNQKDLHDLSLFKSKLVKSGYCPDSDYISKIDSIYQQFKNLLCH